MKVRCIDNKGVEELKIGGIYEAINEVGIWYQLEIGGCVIDYKKKRFTIIEESKEDVIKRPNHYCTGNIETINYIKDKLTKEGYKGYLTGNILKYLSRFEHKNGVEDLKKAQVYLEWLIKELENNEHVETD